MRSSAPSWRTARAWGADGSDEIPRYYYPQVIWEMAVLGVRQAHVAAFMGDQMRIYNIPWSQDVFDALYEAAERFWARHVVPKVPPPPDASAAYADHLARMFPAPDEALVPVADEEALRWLRVAAGGGGGDPDARRAAWRRPRTSSNSSSAAGGALRASSAGSPGRPTGPARGPTGRPSPASSAPRGTSSASTLNRARDLASSGPTGARHGDSEGEVVRGRGEGQTASQA